MTTRRLSATLAACTLALVLAFGLVAALADHLQLRAEADLARALEMEGM